MTPRVLSSGPPRLPRRSSDRRSAFPRPASRRRPGAGNRNRPGGAACVRHGRYDSGTTGPPPWAPSARRLARLGDRAVPRNLRISRGATVDAPCIADEDARNERVPETRTAPGMSRGLFVECWGTWTRTKNDGTRNRCVANYTIPQKACRPSGPVTRGTINYCTASRRSARPPTRSRCTAAAVAAPCPAATMSCSGPGGVTSPTA